MTGKERKKMGIITGFNNQNTSDLSKDRLEAVIREMRKLKTIEPRISECERFLSEGSEIPDEVLAEWIIKRDL
jgi:hypothetical protein